MLTGQPVALLALCGLLSAGAAGCVDISAGEPGQIETVEKHFAVTGTPTVKLGTFDGRVDVTTWDRPDVQVMIEKRASSKEDLERITVQAEQAGDVITVDVRSKDNGFMHMHFGSFGARLRVTVPVQAQIEASTGDGRISIDGVTGDLRVRSGDGTIHLDRVNGSVDATTGDGSIDVDGAIRQLNLRSGDGRVHVRAEGTGPTGEWSMLTGDGSVVLEVADGFNAELDASTGDGRVHVSDIGFDEDRSSRGHRNRAQGRLGQGGARITIRSGDGAITVRRADASTARGSW